MKIITDNNILLSKVPNVVTTVEGEQTLFEKIEPWLVIAEQWVCDTFTGEAVLDDIAADSTTSVWQQTASVIVGEAMRQAIPSLDLVLTPNGFGIVSNQNVAPASKERVERLIETLTASRDLNIDYLLESLFRREDWQNTKQRSWWCDTLMQSPKACVWGVYGSRFRADRWEGFLELRSRARVIESAIAENWIGETLMSRLRLAMNAPGAAVADRHLALKLRECVFSELKGQPRDRRTLDRIVNYVRLSPEEYPEWAESETAKLFAPPVFKNKKESKGYFF